MGKPFSIWEAFFNSEECDNRAHLSIEYVDLCRVIIHDLEAPDAHTQSPLAEQGKTDL